MLSNSSIMIRIFKKEQKHNYLNLIGVCYESGAKILFIHRALF